MFDNNDRNERQTLENAENDHSLTFHLDMHFGITNYCRLVLLIERMIAWFELRHNGILSYLLREKNTFKWHSWSDALNYFNMIDIRIGKNSFYCITDNQMCKQCLVTAYAIAGLVTLCGFIYAGTFLKYQSL